MPSYTRGPRWQLHVGGGLPAELLARLERASDTALNPHAPSKSAIVRRGIELALNEIDALVIQIANELASGRGIKADFANVAYPKDSPEGEIYAAASRVAGILSGKK